MLVAKSILEEKGCLRNGVTASILEDARVITSETEARQREQDAGAAAVELTASILEENGVSVKRRTDCLYFRGEGRLFKQ